MNKNKPVQDKREGLDNAEQKISRTIIDSIYQDLKKIYNIDNEFDSFIAFNNILASKPHEKLIRKHHYLDGVKVIPIEHVYGLLDAVYLGSWNAHSFNWSISQNELIGSIQLDVLNPVSERIVTRTGVAAGRIEVVSLKKEKWDEFAKNDLGEKQQYILGLNENKLPDALKTLIGSVKTIAIKNAAATLGELFGRNLNRMLLHNPLEVKDTNYDELIKLTT